MKLPLVALLVGYTSVLRKIYIYIDAESNILAYMSPYIGTRAVKIDACFAAFEAIEEHG